MDATVFSLQYGLPLLAFAKATVPPVYNSPSMVNTFVPSLELAGPSSTTIVLPNVDTLYSFAVFDLSVDDIVITVPDVESDRYWNFAFYDPFGDNFANIGSLSNSSAGQYYFSRGEVYREGPEVPVADDDTEYQGYLHSPTADGIILVRILLKNNSSDLSSVQSLIEQCKAAPTSRFTEGDLIAPLSESTYAGFVQYAGTNVPLAVLNLLAQLAPGNQPLNQSDINRVDSMLREAGICNYNYTQPPGINLTLAYESLNVSLASAATQGVVDLGNDWEIDSPQGIYYSDYVERSVIAVNGYLELVKEQSIYPSYRNGSMELNSTQAILYTFSSKPPLASVGFWSLTLYNSQGFLEANSYNKYSVGDRSNITYPDASLVYGTGSTASASQSFQILVQPSNTPPPANWTNNWLPAPADEAFSITLRLYAPTTELTNGDWVYPIISNVGAITS